MFQFFKSTRNHNIPVILTFFPDFSLDKYFSGVYIS